MILQFLGEISLPLYLVHHPTMAWLNVAMHGPQVIQPNDEHLKILQNAKPRE